MEETFARTTSKLENVENNIQGGIRAWSNYNVSANGLRVRINEAASAPSSNLEALSLNAEQVWTLMQFSLFALSWQKISLICLSGVINVNKDTIRLPQFVQGQTVSCENLRFKHKKNCASDQTQL